MISVLVSWLSVIGLAYSLRVDDLSVENRGRLIVDTDLGQVIGHYNEVGIREWDGIPYAVPPVGELRWVIIMLTVTVLNLFLRLLA